MPLLAHTAACVAVAHTTHLAPTIAKLNRACKSCLTESNINENKLSDSNQTVSKYCQ